MCRRPENVSVGIMAAISFVPRLDYLTDPQQGRKSNKGERDTPSWEMWDWKGKKHELKREG